MATSNVGRFLQACYDEAMFKYDSDDKHPEALEDLKELLMDDQLSSVLRLSANAALADGVLDWFLAESYRSCAEDAYDDLKSLPILPGSQAEGQLTRFRELLDSLATEQQWNDPRQLKSVSDQHSDAASTPQYPKSSIWLTIQPVSNSALQEPLELPIMGAPSLASEAAAVAHTPTASTEDSGTPL